MSCQVPEIKMPFVHLWGICNHLDAKIRKNKMHLGHNNVAHYLQFEEREKIRSKEPIVEIWKPCRNILQNPKLRDFFPLNLNFQEAHKICTREARVSGFNSNECISIFMTHFIYFQMILLFTV